MKTLRSSLPALVILSISLAISVSAQNDAKFASDRIPAERMQQYAGLAVELEREYLQVDTTNPPGNEARAAAFFKKVLDGEGIENQVFEYAPNRANILGCLPPAGTSGSCIELVRSGFTPGAFILLNHEDVVTSVAERWKVPPFSATVADGVIYGRGAQDMKSDGMAQLMTVIVLKREHVALARPVLFLATGDEEVNGTGTDWMIANRRELLGKAEFLITEGGDTLQKDGATTEVRLDVAEKSPFWLKLTAHGTPGHGSRPMADSAPNRLVRALGRVIAYKTELKVPPVADAFFKAMAEKQSPERAKQYRNVKQSLEDPAFRASIENDIMLNYLLRNTITLTQLEGSHQTNVIPGVATAHLDVRLLPGEDPKKFLEEMKRVVDDPNITVEPETTDFRLANEASLDTSLYAAIKRASARYFPGAPVVPYLTSGYNESQRYRPLGIAAYGFSPYNATVEENSSQHGDNERIQVVEVRRAFRVLYDIVTQVAAR